jgi:hypothetical protein
MDAEFLAKVRDNLWKSGFGSELKAAQTFQGREGWTTGAGHSFFDTVLNQSREFDFAAYKHRFRKRTDTHEFLFHVTIALLAEVKKSERPWAVLRGAPWATPELPFLMHSLIRLAGPIPELQLSQSEVRSEFSKECVSAANGWFGHGVHEVFKKPEEHGRWFEAAAKTCRASAAIAQTPPHQHHETTWVVHYIQPLVILDGILLSAALSGDREELSVEKIPFASVWFEEHGREGSGSFVVDLVTLDALPSYIDRLELGFDHCFNLLAKFHP